MMMCCKSTLCVCLFLEKINIPFVWDVALCFFLSFGELVFRVFLFVLMKLFLKGKKKVRQKRETVETC